MTTCLCRICLSPPLDLKTASTLKDTHGKWTLGFMFTGVTTYNVEESEPQLICEPCKQELINCFSFRQKCGRTQALLLSTQLITKGRVTFLETKNRPEIEKGLQRLATTLELSKYLKFNKKLAEKDPLGEVDDGSELVDRGAALSEKEYFESSCFHSPDSGRFSGSEDLTFDYGPRALRESEEFEDQEPLSIDSFDEDSTDQDVDDQDPFNEDKDDPEQSSLGAECPYCAKIFYSSLLAKNHSALCKKKPKRPASAKAGDLLRCSHCGEKSNQYKNVACLRAHLRRFHGDECKVPCSQCSQPCFPDLLNLHQARCLPKRNIAGGLSACPHCGKLIKRQGLDVHIQRMHGEEVYTCDLCGKETNCKDNLRAHIHEVHLGFKVFCRSCCAGFESQSQLAHHKRKHHPEIVPVLKCTFCSYLTRDSGHLYRHMSSHAGEAVKKHRCKDCGRRFLLQSKLVSHMATHSEEREHLCPICGDAFKRDKDVKKHISHKHSEKGYQCPVCLAKYQTNQNMRTHCQKFHPGYELPPKGTIMKKNAKYKYNAPMTPLRLRK